MRSSRGNFASNYHIINSATTVILAYFFPIFLFKLMKMLKQRRTLRRIQSAEIEKAEVVVQRCSVKIMFFIISQNSQENTCVKVCNFIIKETLAQVFSVKKTQTYKNTFFYRTPLVTASKEAAFK